MSFSALSCNISRISIIVPATHLDVHSFGIVIEKLMFLSAILNTKLVVSNEVTANTQFPSSATFIGGLNEKVSICLFNLKSSVSCGVVFVCQSMYQYVF